MMALQPREPELVIDKVCGGSYQSPPAKPATHAGRISLFEEMFRKW
ncbi:hypothetical protein Hoch_2381 [Haliangium ochraceum DSM 14365]|uniref:Uncharacterized protein n=1 Tax=Haliangium ochraceum (strain DSM 14365 / JCM 11303 / SMP-2) TaxID=502025 RepID=D0LJ71_HALO1|nr:hypothetical protein Hoch_2381 [Haliangium ochraceum DSM 14365]